jgi:acyl-CoA dehydrogenase
MEIELSENQRKIETSVRKITQKFTDEYWHECDEHARFPEEFYAAMAEAGWLGITMPEEVGGAGLGVTEAAIMMHTVASGGGGQAAASSIHINLFGPHAIVVHGSPEQKQRWLTPLVQGQEKACFGVTEPDAGLDTTSIKTFAKRVDGGYRISGRKMWTSTGQEAHKIVILARTTPKSECKRPTDGMSLFYADLDRSKIEVRRIKKLGRNAVDSNATFIDDYFVPEADRIGDEGKGFYYLLDSLNPERVLVGIEALGIGRDALNRAAKYARDRVVFGRPIGKNQGIQHPLAEAYCNIEAAYWMCMRAAYLYDKGLPCGAEANAAKFLSGRASFNATTAAVLTHGGMGYAREFQVERLFRESMLPRIAPVTEQMILNFIAEKVLDLPKSY